MFLRWRFYLVGTFLLRGAIFSSTLVAVLSLHYYQVMDKQAYSKNLFLESLLYALGVVVYISFVAIILFNGPSFFGREMQIFGSIAFLLLFVLSAAIMGLLIFGRPIYLFLHNYRKESITLLLYIIGELVLVTLIVFIELWLKYGKMSPMVLGQ